MDRSEGPRTNRRRDPPSGQVRPLRGARRRWAGSYQVQYRRDEPDRQDRVLLAILLVTLQAAFGVWGPNPISTMLNAVVAWLPKAIVAIIIIVIASAIARVVKDLINGAIGGLSYGPFLASVASVIIIALGAIAAVNQVGIAAAITQPILYTVLLTGGAVIADRRRRRPDQADAGALGADAVRSRAGDQHPDRRLPAGTRRRDARPAARPPDPGRPAGHLPGAARAPRAPRAPATPRAPRARAPATPRAPAPATPRARLRLPAGFSRARATPQGTDPGDWRDLGTQLPVRIREGIQNPTSERVRLTLHGQPHPFVVSTKLEVASAQCRQPQVPRWGVVRARNPARAHGSHRTATLRMVRVSVSGYFRIG